MKCCSKCGDTENLYPKTAKSKTSYCRLCQRKYQAANYQKNRSRYLQAAVERNKRVVEELRQLRDQAKSKPCMDCGVQYDPWIMQFDHRPGEIKIDEITNLIRKKSRPRMVAEIQKCDVVCANCHADRTYRRALIRP